MAESVLANLGDGGVITVLVSNVTEPPREFEHHPRVYFVDVSTFTAHPTDVAKCFPSTSKLLITTAHMPKPFYDALQMELRRRRSFAVYRPTTGSVEAELRKQLAQLDGPSRVASLGDVAKVVAVAPKPKSDAKKSETAERGSVAALAAEADPNKSTAEEGRRLFKLAQSRGITTTLGSVTQAISAWKRKRGLTERPSSAVPVETKKQLTALEQLDAAVDQMKATISALDGIREYLTAVDADVAKMRKKVERAQKIAEQLASMEED